MWWFDNVGGYKAQRAVGKMLPGCYVCAELYRVRTKQRTPLFYTDRNIATAVDARPLIAAALCGVQRGWRVNRKRVLVVRVVMKHAVGRCRCLRVCRGMRGGN